MAIVVTPLGANTINGGFAGASPWVAGSGVTLGTGDVIIFTYKDASGGAIQAPTIGGVLAILIGSNASGLSSAWIATGVNTATGNVSIPYASAYNLVAANWYLITGEGAGTLTTGSFQTFNAPASPSLTATVPASGVGLISLGCTKGSGSLTNNPNTWTNCVASGNTTLESFVGTGNTINVAGNYTTTTGSVTPAVTGTNTYNFQDVDILMVTFPLAGAAAAVPKLTLRGVG